MVTVVILGRRSHLSPFPADERYQVGILRITGHGIALADRFDRIFPMLRRVRLWSVIQ